MVRYRCSDRLDRLQSPSRDGSRALLSPENLRFSG